LKHNENPFFQNRINKRESRQVTRFRFSDLVNANAKSVYLSRDQRDDYHGCAIVLAKEIEYVSMIKTGRRLVDIDAYNRNRIILGHFWLVSEASEAEQRNLFSMRIGSFKSIVSVKAHIDQSRSSFCPRVSNPSYHRRESETPFRRSSNNQISNYSSGQDLKLVALSGSGKSCQNNSSFKRSLRFDADRFKSGFRQSETCFIRPE